MFHFIASEEHFLDHLAPVWSALPERGEFWTVPELVDYLPGASVLPRWVKVARGDYVVFAGEGDRKKAQGVPAVRFEHGIGLSYAGHVNVPMGAPRLAIEAVGRHPAYPGGGKQTQVRLFCQPNRWANARWLQAYPHVPSVIVGTPKMDEFHNAPRKAPAGRPVVAVSFHADITVAPETRSAFPFYSSLLPGLNRRTDIRLIGHAHPRARKLLEPYYAEHGIEFVPRFADVMQRADLYVVDNSSTLYEFASLDRPVVVINSPEYRREVHHGLRFWEHSDVGVNCDYPKDLDSAIDRALEDPPEVQAARRAATEAVFPYRGEATARAVEAMQSLVLVAA